MQSFTKIISEYLKVQRLITTLELEYKGKKRGNIFNRRYINLISRAKRCKNKILKYRKNQRTTIGYGTCINPKGIKCSFEIEVLSLDHNEVLEFIKFELSLKNYELETINFKTRTLINQVNDKSQKY